MFSRAEERTTCDPRYRRCRRRSTGSRSNIYKVVALSRGLDLDGMWKHRFDRDPAISVHLLMHLVVDVVPFSIEDLEVKLESDEMSS